MLADAPAAGQYPLALLLDVFQSIQKKGLPFMLALTGLPTLFPQLVDARTFAERMFRVIALDKLGRDDSREAIRRPLEAAGSHIAFDDDAVELICDHSGGYPYFLQFISREVWDATAQSGDGATAVPMDAITRKLDADFFVGRWARVTDRQRELLWLIAHVEARAGEFSVQEVATHSAQAAVGKPFSNSHVNQMLAALIRSGHVYRNSWGRYSFAIPLFGAFILRQAAPVAAAA